LRLLETQLFDARRLHQPQIFSVIHMIHNLRVATALINRDGIIERIWRGNAWTPAEVSAAIQAESN
jgi:hypothetical protein